MPTPTPRLIAALVTTLQAHLPDLITREGKTAINRWLDYDPGEAWRNDAPIVWVDVAGEDPVEYEAAYPQLERTWSFVIGITSQGANASAAAANLRTYHDLVLECVEENPTLGGELAAGRSDGRADEISAQEAVFTRNLAVSGGLLQESVRTYSIRKETTVGAS